MDKLLTEIFIVLYLNEFKCICINTMNKKIKITLRKNVVDGA